MSKTPIEIANDRARSTTEWFETFRIVQNHLNDWADLHNIKLTSIKVFSGKYLRVTLPGPAEYTMFAITWSFGNYKFVYG